MKLTSFATLGTLALLAAGSAIGQTRMVADIPFEFNVADRALPAGHYEVTQTASVLQVSSYESGSSAITRVIDTGVAGASNAGSHLIFNKYGDKYFLDQVWTSTGLRHGAEVVKSKTEREMASANQGVVRASVPLRKATAVLASIR